MTTLTTLKKLFPSLIEYNHDSITKIDENDYLWFSLDHTNIIGILHTELKEKDKQLLSTFLQPVQVNTPKQSAISERWHERIFSKKASEEMERFRFVYFHIDQLVVDHGLIVDVFEQLFSEEVPIMWVSHQEAIVVESVLADEEAMNYHQIIDVLIADVAVPITFFIGYFKTNDGDLQAYYEQLIETGRKIFSLTNDLVIDYFQAIPYLLLEDVDQLEREELVASVLGEFAGDEEMLQTLQTFLQFNLNVSETAKQLYMHRNSLQYRIDKFMNETNINIQSFDQAVVVQLALIANKMMENTKG